MIGCGGDANPYPRGTMENARELGATLGREVGRILGTPLRPVSGPLTCVFDHASVPLQQFSRAELVQIARRHGRTVSQVVFRFALDVGMVPLTGTTDAGHMREDLEVFEFRLEPEEVERIELLGG